MDCHWIITDSQCGHIKMYQLLNVFDMFDYVSIHLLKGPNSQNPLLNNIEFKWKYLKCRWVCPGMDPIQSVVLPIQLPVFAVMVSGQQVLSTARGHSHGNHNVSTDFENRSEVQTSTLLYFDGPYRQKKTHNKLPFIIVVRYLVNYTQICKAPIPTVSTQT